MKKVLSRDPISTNNAHPSSSDQAGMPLPDSERSGGVLESTQVCPDAVSQNADSDDSSVTLLPLSAGKKLKAAREKAGISIEEAASCLFLHASFIKHIENDAYDRLPGPTFIKGYIKAYSRLVSLPYEPLLTRFNEDFAQSLAQGDETTGGSDSKRSSGHKLSKEGRSSRWSIKSLDLNNSSAHRPFSIVPHILIIVLIVGAIAWLVSQDKLSDMSGLFDDTQISTQAAPDAEGSNSSTMDEQAAMSTESSVQDTAQPPAIDQIRKSPKGEVSTPSGALPEKTPVKEGDPQTLNRLNEGLNEAHTVLPVERLHQALKEQPAVISSKVLQVSGWSSVEFEDMHVKQIQAKQPGMVTAYRIELPNLKSETMAEHPNSLRLAFLETANVYVEDGTGISAHSQTHAQGSEVQVALLGPPPYLLALSASGAVSVKFNDRAIELPNP